MGIPIVESPAIPTLLIAGAHQKVGKTVIAAGIADWFNRDGVRAAVMKPFDTFCEHRREGWVSLDAEFLATAARTPHPLDLICPVRSNTNLPPALSSEPVAWELVNRSISNMSRDVDVLVVEATPGLLDPIGDGYSMLDIAKDMKARAVLVVQASQPLHVAMVNLLALRGANIPLAGVVINRYPAGTASGQEEQFPRALERFGRVRVLTIVPDDPVSRPSLPAGIVEAVEKVDWLAVANGR